MSDSVVATYDISSLEAFTSELVGAGFEPVPAAERRAWRSRIHPAFAPLTTATTMALVLHDGWPYVPPSLIVQGLDTNHSMLNGLVCMWRDGDASLRWTTVEGLFERIEEWCRDAQEGWGDDDLGRDAYLNFTPKVRGLAVLDLTAFETSRGSWGDLHGVRRGEQPLIELSPGRASTQEHLAGLWFRVGQLAVPPRNLSELRRCLARPQRKGLERALKARRSADVGAPSGGIDLILLCWERGSQLEVLVIACVGTGDEMEGMAVQAGPNDEENLILRAGPDAEELRQMRVVVFGAGALGGHAAVTLAESGAGFLRLVDGELLMPGNVVRHVARHESVGAPKVLAVEAAVRGHAPWSEVECVEESPMRPDEFDALISDVDLVIDTTGNTAATFAVASRARALGRRFVSGALYRGGRVARVRRVARSEDSALHERDIPRYPIIRPDEEGDVARAAVGCSAPVNNAPPTSVQACSSLIVRSAIDVLTGRFEFPDEVIDVYRGLPGSPPFDRTGKVAVT